MRVREIYNYVLIEQNKENSSTLLLEDFNYVLYKASIQVCNMSYAFYEKTQQYTDTLRALKRSTELVRQKVVDDVTGVETSSSVNKSNFFLLPTKATIGHDYWHMLDCKVGFKKSVVNKCSTDNDTLIYIKGIKTNSQIDSGIMDDYYTKPSIKRPYYSVYNYNPANTTTLYNLEIKCGENIRCDKVKIDYLKFPNKVELTEDELYADIDTSTLMEFPDDVCIEIINKMLAILLENTSDPRLRTHTPTNMSVVPPQAK